MILVTGSTGTFGNAVLQKLKEEKIENRAVSRDTFDWNKPETFKNILKGIEKIFLIAPPNFKDFDKKASIFIEEAKKSNVKFILFSSLYGADKTQENSFGKTEKIISECGINYSIVRPNFIFQNFITYDIEAIKSGNIYLPTKNSKTSYVDVNDVATASFTIFKNPEKHFSKEYTLTGSESLSHKQFADTFSIVLGKKITNINPTNNEYKATLLSYGLPQDLVDFMGYLYSAIEAGNFIKTTNDYEVITGNKPTTAKEFVELNRSTFI